MSNPKTDQGDLEAKEVHLNKAGQPLNVCGGFSLGTRFIDVRTNDKNSTPFDEIPNQNILKISAT